jgi:hypothetical protein
LEALPRQSSEVEGPLSPPHLFFVPPRSWPHAQDPQGDKSDFNSTKPTSTWPYSQTIHIHLAIGRPRTQENMLILSWWELWSSRILPLWPTPAMGRVSGQRRIPGFYSARHKERRNGNTCKDIA